MSLEDNTEFLLELLSEEGYVHQAEFSLSCTTLESIFKISYKTNLFFEHKRKDKISISKMEENNRVILAATFAMKLKGVFSKTVNSSNCCLIL